MPTSTRRRCSSTGRKRSISGPENDQSQRTTSRTRGSNCSTLTRSRRRSSKNLRPRSSNISLWALRFFQTIIGVLGCTLTLSVCLALREKFPPRVQQFLALYVQPIIVYSLALGQRLWTDLSPYLAEFWRLSSTTDISEVKIFAKGIASRYPVELAVSFSFFLSILLLLLLHRLKSRTKNRKGSTGTTMAFAGRHYGTLNSEEEALSSSFSEDGGEDFEGFEEDSTSELVGEDRLYVERPLSAEEFRKQAEEHTLKELTSLYRTPEFRSLVRNRGKEDLQYNWQKRRTAREVKSR